MKTRLCVFDLDGTLVNSLEDLADSANAVLARRGYPTHETQRFRWFIGGGIPALIRRILPEEVSDAVREEVRAEFAARYEEHCLDKTRPYEGILDLLRALEEKGVPVCVFSNKDHAFTCRIVEAVLPGQKFAFVQGMEPGMPKKPDPAGLLKNLEALGITPEECLYLGDSGVDMQTALQAGCVAAGVLWGFREREELLEHGAKHLIARPMEALALLEE